MNPATEQKEYARHFKSLIRGKPAVFRYHNESNDKHIDILSGQYLDYENIVFYSTIGLSLYDFGIENNGKSLRMEVIAAFYKDFEQAGNLLSHCAFDIIDDNQLSPNLILPNIVKEYVNSNLSEIWITFPNLLEQDLITMEFDEYTITTLQLMPVSLKESEIAMTDGGSKLGKLFEEKDVDQFDIHRNSIL